MGIRWEEKGVKENWNILAKSDKIWILTSPRGCLVATQVQGSQCPLTVQGDCCCVMGGITLLRNFSRKRSFYRGRQDYNSQEAPWPRQALDAEVPLNKTSSLACSLRVRRTIVVLEGKRREKSTWQCDFYKQPCFFLLEYWSYGTKQ